MTAANRRLKIVYRALRSLKPDSTNARTHPPAQIDQLARAISERGFWNPIIIDDDAVIIAGHGRWMGAEKAGLDEVPTITLSGLSIPQRTAIALADNKIGLNSGWDEALLRQAIETIEAGGEDVTITGFEPGELDRLLEDAGPLAVKRIETAPVQDRFWISVRGPLASQAAALAGVRKALAGLSGVDVELGTTPDG